MFKKILLIAMAVLMAMAGSAFAAPKKGGTIVMGRGADSPGLDPAYETDGNSFMVCDNIYPPMRRTATPSWSATTSTTHWWASRKNPPT